MKEINFYTPLVTVVVESVLWLVPFIFLAAALRSLLWRRFKGWQGEQKIGKALDGLFDDVFHDIVVPDGRGGLTQIDHVALTSRGLLVVETKNFGGAIYGAEYDQNWTQWIGGGSYPFPNPLDQNRLHVSALESLDLGLPVLGRVVFTDESMFPKGIPRGVSQLRNLADDLRDHVGGSIPLAYEMAWQQLRRVARQDRSAHREHLSLVQAKGGGDDSRHRLVTGAMLVLPLTWLAVLWWWSGPPFSMAQRALDEFVQRQPSVGAESSSIFHRDSAAHPIRPGTTATTAAPAKPVVEIRWSKGPTSDREACNLAKAALLIEDTPENRRMHDLACDTRSGGSGH